MISNTKGNINKDNELKGSGVVGQPSLGGTNCRQCS